MVVLVQRRSKVFHQNCFVAMEEVKVIPKMKGDFDTLFIFIFYF